MEIIILGIWCVLLFILAICDIKWRKIPIIGTAFGTIGGVVFCIVSQRELVEILWAMSLGIACLVYSKISKEALGYGDSLLLCSLGLVLDVEHMLLICMIAFGVAGIGALVMLVFFHKKKKYEMPFVPFLWMAFVIDALLQIGGSYG